MHVQQTTPALPCQCRSYNITMHIYVTPRTDNTITAIIPWVSPSSSSPIQAKPLLQSSHHFSQAQIFISIHPASPSHHLNSSQLIATRPPSHASPSASTYHPIYPCHSHPASWHPIASLLQQQASQVASPNPKVIHLVTKSTILSYCFASTIIAQHQPTTPLALSHHHQLIPPPNIMTHNCISHHHHHTPQIVPMRPQSINPHHPQPQTPGCVQRTTSGIVHPLLIQHPITVPHHPPYPSSIANSNIALHQ